MAKPGKQVIQYPRDALSKIQLGDGFAEYDRVLPLPNVFVKTPAAIAASDPKSPKCFFVGRRGTGKTAIALHVATAQKKHVAHVHPLVLAPTSIDLQPSDFHDTKKKAFKTMVACYKRTLLLEVISQWLHDHATTFDKLSRPLKRERQLVEGLNFDARLLATADQFFAAYKGSSEGEWARLIGGTKQLVKDVDDFADPNMRYTLLIDRIDEYWDGSDKSVAFLTCLMHACVELMSFCNSIRPLLFLRENIFERVRQKDVEFAKLDNSVVSLDWSREHLREMVERRLTAPFIAKLPADGTAWDYFFEQSAGEHSRDFVFTYCQERPRDVLTFCKYAIESAQHHARLKVQHEDLQAARRKFSETKLRELCEEYAENYPQIQAVLGIFHGHGNEFTYTAIEGIVQGILVNDTIKQLCGRWIFHYTPPDRFIHLLYSIGFVGLGVAGASPQYRSLGANTVAPPAITNDIRATIHPSYVDALSLRQTVVTQVDPNAAPNDLQLDDKPSGIATMLDYVGRLDELYARLENLPPGQGKPATEFEDVVGDIVKLCFFRSLTNVEPKVRDVAGTTIRDWIAANTASSGFWETIRSRYNAMQVIWECKNYADLKSDDFHQALYYMGPGTGRFVVIAFRGAIKDHYYEHIKNICSKNDGMVLLLGEGDLKVFIRQSKNGKMKESHISERYDATVRKM